MTGTEKSSQDTASGPYSDLLTLPYPRPSRRERMSQAERAKIFMPFAALKGFDALLAAKAEEPSPKGLFPVITDISDNPSLHRKPGEL